jgi:RimJ/RimL family protein N-acetyltransferase
MMARVMDDDDDDGIVGIGLGPAVKQRALAEAAAKLAARRQRDALPHRIATPRLTLRAPIRGDVPDLVRLADNPVIAERLARLPSPYTRADGIAFVEIFAQRADERPYAMVLDDRFIGVVGLSFHPGAPPELGYWLGEPWWGRGLMSEAAKAVCDAAFATRRIDRIIARALPTNLASQRVLEKLGFTRGELGPSPTNGREVVNFALDKPRWG